MKTGFNYTLFYLYALALVLGGVWTFIPSLSTSLPISKHEYGIVTALVSVGAIGATLFFAGMNFGTRRVLRLGHLLLFTGVVIFFFSYVIGAFFLGASIGAQLISISSYTFHAVCKKKTSAILGTFFFMGLGSMLFPIIENTLLLGSENWPYLLVFFILYALSFVGMPRKELPVKMSIKNKSNSITLFVLIGLLFGAFEGVIANYTPQFIGEGGDNGLGAFWGSSALGELFFAFLFLRARWKWLYALIPVFMGIAALSIHLPYWPILTFGILGFVTAPFTPLTLRFAEGEFEKKDLTPFGVYFATYLIGSSLAAYSIGFFEQFMHISIDHLFYLVPLFAMLLIVLTLLVVKRYRKEI